MSNTFFRVALFVVASITLVVGVSGAIVLFPGDSGDVSQAHSRSQLTWQSSLSAGGNLAMQEHKYVLVDVYTEWCGWCKRLDKDVFTDSDVVNYLQKDFICVKVNAEDPREGTAVARVYKVNGFPCALVFSPEGKLIGRIPGFKLRLVVLLDASSVGQSDHCRSDG